MLSEERIQRLDEIGFRWQSIARPSWDEMFLKLVEFKKIHGHCNVPFNWSENPKLAWWVVNQRRRRTKNGPLSEKRIRLLNEVGFQWQVLYNSLWNTRFSELVEFKKVHGHCNVQSGWPENPKLSVWVAQQRGRRKKGNLSKERIRRLEELGFIWSIRDAFWEEMFSLLVKFKKTHGHCNVSQTEHRRLGKWVSRQRQVKKEGKISKDRIRRLEELGFQWQIRNKATIGD